MFFNPVVLMMQCVLLLYFVNWRILLNLVVAFVWLYRHVIVHLSNTHISINLAVDSCAMSDWPFISLTRLEQHKCPSHLLCFFIFVLYIHEHLYKIWLSYYVMLNLIKVQHMYIWPGKQLKISFRLGKEDWERREKDGWVWRDPYFLNFRFLVLPDKLNSGPIRLSSCIEKGSMLCSRVKLPLIVSGMFWSII